MPLGIDISFNEKKQSGDNSEGSDKLLSPKQLLTICGTLWVFCGLTTFTIVKDVLLSDRAPHLPRAVWPFLEHTILLFYWVNGSGVILTQVWAAWLITREPSCGTNSKLLIAFVALGFSIGYALIAQSTIDTIDSFVAHVHLP